MTFKPGDAVRLKEPPRTQMTIKSISAAGVLCEWIEAGAFQTCTWPAETLELVLTRRRGPPRTVGQGVPGI